LRNNCIPSGNNINRRQSYLWRDNPLLKIV
jgi:hypothetical protein